MVDLKRAVVSVIRTSTPQVDRRALARHKASLACRISCDGRAPFDTRTAELSEKGARIFCDRQVALGTKGTMRLATIAEPLAFVVERIDPDGWGLQILLTDGQGPVWQALIRSVIARAA